jgi:5-hydroxyisourate hydrolase-like protein (transthyretin family)
MLFGTAANGNEPHYSDTDHVPSGQTTYGGRLELRWREPPNPPFDNVSTSYRLSPDNGSAMLDHAHRTDDEGWTWFKLTFHENACGTYTVTMWIDHLGPSEFTYQARIVYWKPCPGGTTSSSTGTSSSSSEATSPPPSPNLVKISDDNQVTHPEDGVTLSVELQDSDGSPTSDVDVTFFIQSGDRSRASLSPVTATTDANGRAQTTLTFATDAAGDYIIEAYRSDTAGIYTQFTVTVDPLLPKATRLEKISGDNQTGLTGGVWAAPFVVEVRDQYDAPLASTPVTFTVLTGGGRLSAETTTTNANGQAASTLRLGAAPGTNTVEVSVEGISEPVIFTAATMLPTLTSVSGNNQIGVVGTALANPFVVEVHDGSGSPLTGVLVTFVVRTGDGTLSAGTTTTDANGWAASTLRLGTAPGTNTVEVSAEGITEMVTFTAVAELLDFDLSLSTGFNLIHLPLKVRVVDGMPTPIQSVSDLYDALGGADTVNWLLTHNPHTQGWDIYFGDRDRGTTADSGLTDQTGILANMLVPASIRLGGDALGTAGSSTLTLTEGYNLVGLPLRDSRVTRMSDLFSLDGIGGNVPIIIVTDNGEFKTVSRAGDPGDIAITGGQSFVLTAQRAATVGISGEGWTNVFGIAAAPLIGNADLHSPVTDTNTTPVLALSGSIVDGEMDLKVEGFRVTVKNLSTGKAVTTMTPSDKMDYRFTVVDLEMMRVATVGDILEISAESPQPFVGVKPLRYTVTAEDIKRHRIQLPTLVAYEIPTETALLPNYPNPFNPETWIPYRLGKDAEVTLTIYDGNGQVVRTFDVGHQIASAYTDRSQAIYWDGQNELGEPVASDVYFYTLTVRSLDSIGAGETGVGNYSATRKMVILK